MGCCNLSSFSSYPRGEIAPDYVVNLEGTRYVAEGGRKHKTIRYSDHSDVWNEMFATVGAGLAVEYGRGEFAIDDSVPILSRDISIQGLGPRETIWKAVNGLNKDMLVMSTYHHNFFFGHIGLDGNQDNNTSGRGIDFDVADASWSVEQGSIFWGWHGLEDIMITECKEDAFYIRTVIGANTESYLHNFRIWNNGGGSGGTQGSYVRLFDSFIGGARCSISSLRFSAGASNHVEGVYFGGGGLRNLLMEGGTNDLASGSQFINCRFDHATLTAIDITDQQRRHQFTGCGITNFSQAVGGDDSPAVFIDGNACYIDFNTCFFGHINVENTQRFNHAIEEGASTHDNHLKGCTAGYGEISGSGTPEHFSDVEALLQTGNGSTIRDCVRHDGKLWRVKRV